MPVRFLRRLFGGQGQDQDPDTPPVPTAAHADISLVPTPALIELVAIARAAVAAGSMDMAMHRHLLRWAQAGHVEASTWPGDAAAGWILRVHERGQWTRAEQAEIDSLMRRVADVSEHVPRPTPSRDLLKLPGVGPAFAQRLADAGFTTLEAVRQATDSDLSLVAGMGDSTLERVRAHLDGGTVPPYRPKPLRDSDAQPPASFQAGARRERGMSELMGLIRGVLADGEVSEAEAVVLRDWIAANPDVAGEWPANVLARRLHRIFEDGVVDAEERAGLAALLQEFTGGGAGVEGGFSRSSTLPVDSPQPEIEFEGRVFVLTGAFVYGPRRVCQEAIEGLGGRCERDITHRTHYLVIGTVGSRDWVESTHGRKIEKAVDYRDGGQRLAIISEDHWVAHIP